MTYSVVARNFSEEHDNKIHSDEIARKYGFTGALVPGVAVFGHLVQPLVERHGEDWLGASASHVRFAQPAYHGDRLSIDLEPLDAAAHTHSTVWPSVTFNERSTVIARGTPISTLESSMLEQLPEPFACGAWNNPAKPAGRPEMEWDTVSPEQPFAAWDLELRAGDNRLFTEQIADTNALYETFVHPHWILSIANSALTREYVMPAWIHVGSELCLRSALRVGDRIQVRAVPLEKWERKGHQFLRLYLAYYRGPELTTEVMHTAIFRVAQ